MDRTILQTAESYVSAGLSVIPVRTDGTKAPAVKWTAYQTVAPTQELLSRWFATESNHGIGIVCGKVSQSLEVLDFDDEEYFNLWHELMCNAKLMPNAPVVKSPRGFHVYLKRPGDVACAGNQKLCRVRGEGSSIKVTIETRGQGGQVVAPGSPAECHPSGDLYRHHSGPTLDQWAEVPIVNDDLYQAMIAMAVSLSNVPLKPIVEEHHDRQLRAGEVRPGDAFSAKADFAEILKPFGWVLAFSSGETEFWRRPGKDRGHSATAHLCRHPANGWGLFYCFSSSAPPIESGRAYSAFQLLAVLNHNGDWAATASVLRASGYGTAPQLSGVEFEEAMKARGLKLTSEQQKSLDESKAKEQEAVPLDREGVIAKISADLGLPFIKLVQSTYENPTYWLYIEGQEKIRLGSVSAVLSCREFEHRLVERLRTVLPEGLKKRGAWPKFIKLMISVCEIEDTDWRDSSELKEWIEDYVHSGRRFDDNDWGEALEGNKPFVRDDRLHLHAEDFQKFLKWGKGQLISKAELIVRFHESGFIRRKMNTTFKDRSQCGRWYWWSPAGLWLPDDQETSDVRVH